MLEPDCIHIRPSYVDLVFNHDPEDGHTIAFAGLSSITTSWVTSSCDNNYYIVKFISCAGFPLVEIRLDPADKNELLKSYKRYLSRRDAKKDTDE